MTIGRVVWAQYINVTNRLTATLPSATFSIVEALGRIIIGGPYPPSNAIIYMHLKL